MHCNSVVSTLQVILLLSHRELHAHHAIGGFHFWGEDPSHNGLSLARKFVLVLISPNLYPKKQKVKEDRLYKQVTLMNSNK